MWQANAVIQIEYLPTSSLNAAPYNPRRMPDEQMAQLMRGIEAFGLVDPIIVNQATGNIVGGHQRVEAAKRLKLAEVPVVHVSLDREQEKALNLALNKISGEWDIDLLRGILGDLNADGFDLELTGFSAGEVADLLAGGLDGTDAERELGDPDDVPEVDEQAPPVTQPGDLIILGNHRLLCGNSTKAEDVARLMDGALADMVWTDPPYGVAYVGKTKDALTIQNDDLSEEGLEAFLRDALSLASDACRAGAPWYVAAPAGPLHYAFATVLKELGIWRQTLNWVKNTFALGRSDYHYRHEPIFYGWKPGAAHYHCGDRTQDTVIDDDVDIGKLKKEDLVEIVKALRDGAPTTVIREDKPTRCDLHPTMKPVALVARLVENSSVPGDVVLDPFGGSGTTLIACTRLGRNARLLELDPKYCDVIVNRWEKFTGKTAQRPERKAASGRK